MHLQVLLTRFVYKFCCQILLTSFANTFLLTSNLSPITFIAVIRYCYFVNNFVAEIWFQVIDKEIEFKLTLLAHKVLSGAPTHVQITFFRMTFVRVTLVRGPFVWIKTNVQIDICLGKRLIWWIALC